MYKYWTVDQQKWMKMTLNQKQLCLHKLAQSSYNKSSWITELLWIILKIVSQLYQTIMTTLLYLLLQKRLIFLHSINHNSRNLEQSQGIATNISWIFYYLKTRRYKHYTLNFMYIKLHKLFQIRNLTKSMKFWSQKLNHHTVHCQ